MYQVVWHPGQENLADYQSKHHPGGHHVAVRPWYLHMDNSPRVLPRALKPSTLKGCVGTLKDGYLRKVPLPRAPLRQSPALAAVAALATGNPEVTPFRRSIVPNGSTVPPFRRTGTCYLQVPQIPTWSDLARSHLGAIRSTMLPLAPRWLM
jgi:hypothetical protein